MISSGAGASRFGHGLRPGVQQPTGVRRAPGAKGEPSPLRSLDVYLVEDNVLVLESLIAALEELAPIHVIGTAADESVAVQWLQAGGEACDLVIVDVFLRTGSGLGVIAAARRQRPDAALVVLSNYATDEMRLRCLASGADRVFDKSRDIDLLVAYCIALAEDRSPGGDAPH
jgi:two-component system OmpR family response regulator